MANSVARTRGALHALAAECERLGARAVIIPIPSHSAVDPEFAEKFGELLGLTDVGWSADHPVELFLSAAREASASSSAARA